MMNEQEFIEIFRKHNEAVYNYLYIRTRSREISQDLTQEIFIKLWKSRSKFNSDKSGIRTWIFRITRNHLIDFFRKKKIEFSNEDLENFHSESESISPDLAFVLDKLKEMNDYEEDLIVMKYIQGLSNDEIAKVINKSVNATKVACLRALNKLKMLINK